MFALPPRLASEASIIRVRLRTRHTSRPFAGGCGCEGVVGPVGQASPRPVACLQSALSPGRHPKALLTQPAHGVCFRLSWEAHNIRRGLNSCCQVCKHVRSRISGALPVPFGFVLVEAAVRSEARGRRILDGAISAFVMPGSIISLLSHGSLRVANETCPC